jgi:hypothetical protein
MENFRRTGLLDYFIYELLDYRNIDIFGKGILNILFVTYLCYFKVLNVDHLKGLRTKGLIYYFPLFIFHIVFYINRQVDHATLETIDTICSFCLFFILQRDLYR